MTMDSGFEDSASPQRPGLIRYWQRTRRLTLGLLLIWTVLSFVVTYFARELSFNFFGWPFSFWMASQGALLGYCGIVVYYAWAMRRLDDQYANDGS